MTRVERISLTSVRLIPSMAEIFQRKVGRSIMDYSRSLPELRYPFHQ